MKNRYSFIKPLGGSGVIILVIDDTLNLNRALKTLRPKVYIAKIIASFKSEIEHLNEIQRENVIRIFYLNSVKNYDYDFEYPFFIMEYISIMLST